ncbi:MAG: UDP-2,3-diacylglucosamine diphosphatase [Aquabacterium sp.]|nr:UDP-2,3-diacylglucosamine diphosphatase [Aquabacterium sp.]
MAASLPAFAALQASPAWRCIDLLSDVHLHADMPCTFAAWRAHLLTTSADAVLVLGDLFEVWVGDDAADSGFAADCVAVLRAASAQRAVYFLPGNRDFLVGDALLAATGLQRLADPTVLQAFGQRWLLAHGDALCLDDTAYQQFRQQVRSPAWQQAFLAQPLAERERQARAMRDASAAHQADLGPTHWSDVDDNEAARWLAAAGCQALVHGHTHRPATHALPGGGTRHVLGDWDFDHGAPRARALRLTAAGLQVLDLAA